tara:strand:+ start:169 stop:636 length:468 start_codon:yes stop_codon:yes gene_type:complete
MNDQATQPQMLSLRGQYIKDISFENPRAPQSLLNLKEPPAIEINVDLSAQRLQDNMFELTMHIGARASQDKTTVFLTDLAYGGIFDVPGDENTDFERLVLVDCAYMLFPFARRIVAEITRDGGFPPLQIEPVNFAGLYEQNKGNIQRAAPQAAAE